MGQDNKWHAAIFIILIFFIVALFSFLFTGLIQKEWTFSYVVEPIDLINLIVTFLISVFVAWYITKQLSEERFEKELIISDLKAIEECMKRSLDLLTPYNQTAKNISDGELIMHSYNELQILISRFKKTVSSRNIDTNKLSGLLTQFYKEITNFDSSVDIKNLDYPQVQQLGDDLIIEVRDIIRKINII